MPRNTYFKQTGRSMATYSGGYKRKRTRRYYNSGSRKNWAHIEDNNQRIVSVPGRYVMPKRLKTQFEISQVFTITSTSGANQDLIVAGNDLFDPLATSGSTQPNGFDNITAFYTNFGVISSKIEIVYNNLGGTVSVNAPAWKVCIFPTRTLSGTNMTFSNACMLPGARYSYVGQADGGQSVVRLKNYARTTDITNLDPLRCADVQGDTATSPQVNWFWHCIAQPLNESTTATLYVQLTVTYYTYLHNLQVLPKS